MRKFKDGDHVVIVYPSAKAKGKTGYIKLEGVTYKVIGDNGEFLGNFCHEDSVEHSILQDSPLMKALR